MPHIFWQGGIILQGTFNIVSYEKTIGTAEVTKQGLYYSINCFCKGEFRPHCRIAIALPSEQVDLGRCIPLTDGFGMRTHIPLKRLGDNALKFILIEPEEHASVLFIPLEENKPFGYLTKLRNARFAVRNGKTGIIIEKDYSSISKPTGQ